jgi:hypothetical protein
MSAVTLRAVVDVGGFAEGRIRAAHVVMVAAEDNRTDVSVTHHLVELQGDAHAAFFVRVQNACLGADHQLVLFRRGYPVMVVAVHGTPRGIDACHGGLIGFAQILVLAAQAHPAEGTETVVETHGAHDVLHIRRPDEALGGVAAVFRNRGFTRIENRGHEAVAVIPEMGALSRSCV